MTTTKDLTIAPPVYESLRMTVPAREALERAGNTVDRDGEMPDGHALYRVTLRVGVAVEPVLIGQGGAQHRGLRLADEPEYPGEWPSGQGIAWYERGQWVPCPRCGAALVWYETGYVPGYRVCVRGHHAQLSRDGRTAKRM